MNAPVTRRALLGATAAVGAVTLPAIAEAGIAVLLPGAPDAELFGLIADHARAESALRAAEEDVDCLADTAVADHPPQPQVLIWSPDDFPRTSYGRGASDEEGQDGRRRYRERGVEWLRRHEPSAAWTAGHEARRREIVEAWDGWRAACDGIDERAGLPAAEIAVEQAEDAVAAIMMTILATKPTTLAGLAAKMQWAAPENEPDTPAMAWRLRQAIEDVVALAGRGGVAA